MHVPIRAIAAIACIAAACSGASAQQPSEMTEAEKQAAISSGLAILDVLKDPKRCGGDAPRANNACALMLYQDISSRANDRLPERVTVRVRAIEGLGGPPEGVKVIVQSPFDNCQREVSVFNLARMRASYISPVEGGEKSVMQIRSVIGWAENEGLPARDPRRTEAKNFKLGQCTFGR